MNLIERSRRKKLMLEAEGYLDLIMSMDDRWPLELEQRIVLAECALSRLNHVAERYRVWSIDWYLRGQAYRLCEHYEDAADCLRKSLELNSDNIGAYLALGWCYKRLGQIPLAINALESALELGSEIAIVHYNLSCYWALSNEAEIAAFHLTAAIDLNSDFRHLVDREPDFDLVREHPEFIAAVKSLA